jgi:hypothetical protein
MLVLDQELSIGSTKFPAVKEVQLKSSRKIPVDTLKILLPKYRNLKKDSIQKYDKVRWFAGYTQYGLFPEFAGYVMDISPRQPFEINCVDPMHFCQKQQMKKNYSKTPILQFLNDCIHPEIKEDITIEIVDPDIVKMVNITCANRSARYALSQLSNKYGVDVFFIDFTMIIQKAYVHTTIKKKKGRSSKTTGASTSVSDPKEIPKFIFNYNIISDNLVPREKKEFKIMVRGENLETGLTYKATYPSSGAGETVYHDIDDLDFRSASERAKEIFEEKCGSGFNGNFLTFGYPTVTHSQVIEVIDRDDESRTAKTFINEVVKTYSVNGYRQEIIPGFFHEPPKTRGRR